MPAIISPLSLPVASRERIWLVLQREYEARITGKVVSGSGSGQAFSKENMTWDQFVAQYNAFADVMVPGSGVDDGGVSQTRPNFSGRCCVDPLKCP